MLFSKIFLKNIDVRQYYLVVRKLCYFKGNLADLNFTCYENNRTDSDVPVVILHGLLASKTSWAWMSDSIHRATGRIVVNVDARNHGTSPHAHQNTYIDMACDIVRLIQKLDLPKVTLLGHSMGGRTAMTVALLYPELVSSLITVDISPVSTSQQLMHSFPIILDAINAIDLKGIVSINEAIEFAREQMRKSGVNNDQVIEFVLRNIHIKNDSTIQWRPNVRVLRADLPTLLKFPYLSGKVFTGPTLFIRAEQSNFLPTEDLPGIKTYYPQAELKSIPGVGHNIHEEDPQALLKLTTDFLDKTRKF